MNREERNSLAFWLLMITLTILFFLLVTAVFAQQLDSTIEGKLLVLSDGRYMVRTANGTFEITLDPAWGDPKQYWQGLKNGDMVRFKSTTGLKATLQHPTDLEILQGYDQELAPDGLDGQRTVIFIGVTLQDLPIPPYSLQVMTGKIGLSGQWLQEVSRGRASLALEHIIGWQPINVGSFGCDVGAIADQARLTAAIQGINPNSYQHVIYGFPFMANCNWLGLATVGGDHGEIWLNGPVQGIATIVHELGHNGGLLHSHAFDCVGVLMPPCQIFEYGDMADVMGSGFTSHYNSVQKFYLGWLTLGDDLIYAGTSGLYRLQPYALQADGVKALAIKHAGLTDTYFTLEYRQPIGFDEDLQSWAGLTNGVLMHMADASDLNTISLLDANPQTPQFTTDAALQPGQVFAEPNTGFSLSTLSVHADEAFVVLLYDGDELSIQLSGETLYQRGQTLSFAVDVRIGAGEAAFAEIAGGVLFPNGYWYPFGPMDTDVEGHRQLSAYLDGSLPVGTYTVFVWSGWMGMAAPVVQGSFQLF